MFNNKVIFISGGTGSFGKEFVKDILKKYKPKKIIIFSRDELKQYELSQYFNNNRLRFFLGDVRDGERVKRACANIDIIIHAAAMKHVTASEYNPTECIETNINGAKNIIDASIENNIKKVIALSTDKAASPINLYGATKLCSDKLFIAANNLSGKHKTRFSVVRYGNVINSRGSVIPFFLEKIKAKEKYLPLTDINMTRFFLTIEQGVNFVLNSLSRMQGGEIFVPKCPSIKITELAKILKKNVKFKIVGIRPGEKIHEVLCPKEDALNTIEFKNFYMIKPTINFNRRKNYNFLPTKEKGRYVKKDFEYTSNNSLDNKSKYSIKKLIEKKS